jgi:predicted RND superfamily exporter protein
LRENILKKIAHISYHSYRIVISIGLVVTIISLLLAFRLQLKADVIHLLPPESKAAKVFYRAISSFGTFDYLIAYVQGRNVQEIEIFSDAFARELGTSDLIEDVDYKISGEMRAFFQEELLKSPHYYLSSSDIKKLRTRLSDESIRCQIRENRRLLASPLSFATKEFVRKDPFNLRSIFKEYILEQKGPYNLDLTRGYYFAAEGNEARSPQPYDKALLMIIKPKTPPTDIEFDKELFKTVQAAEGKASREGIKVDYTGGYIMALDDEGMIRGDILLTLSLAFFSVLGLFFLTFRRRETFFFVSLPLLMGLAWTVGIAALYPRHLNMVTFGFFPILIGLGVDYAIHIYNRYLEEQKKGRDTLSALEITLSQTGAGILTGALTTAVAFYALTFTEFRGLSELGFLSGTGILACLVSMFFVLPAILSWQSRRLSSVRPEQVKMQPLSSFGLQKFSQALLRAPRITLSIAAVVTCILGFCALGITFDSDFRNLRPKASPALQVQDMIGKRFGSAANPLLIIASGRGEEEVLQANERVVQRIEELKKEGKIKYYHSPVTLLASQKRARENIEELRKFDFERIITTFQEALRENNFRFGAYRDYTDEIRSLKRRLEGPLTEAPPEKSLEKLTRRYFTKDETGWRVLTLAYPAKTVPSPPEVDELENRIKGNEPDVDITGVGMVTNELRELITKDFILAMILTFTGIFIMLLVHFRRIKMIILALIPLVCGIIWMLGVMRLLGLRMNFVNIVVTPLILGIGIDDGIHIIHRYLEERSRRRSASSADVVEDTIYYTGRAVVMTSLTTMAGFGSLIFARYKGLATMGTLALLGVGLCLVASLTVLPALLKIMEDNGKPKRPSQPV